MALVAEISTKHDDSIEHRNKIAELEASLRFCKMKLDKKEETIEQLNEEMKVRIVSETKKPKSILELCVDFLVREIKIYSVILNSKSFPLSCSTVQISNVKRTKRNNRERWFWFGQSQSGSKLKSFFSVIFFSKLFIFSENICAFYVDDYLIVLSWFDKFGIRMYSREFVDWTLFSFLSFFLIEIRIIIGQIRLQVLLQLYWFWFQICVSNVIGKRERWQSLHNFCGQRESTWKGELSILFIANLRFFLF